MSNTKTILTPSFAVYNVELQQAFDDGWRLDMDNLPSTWGICYEAVLVKDEHRAAIMDAFKEAPGEMDFSVVSKEAPKRGRPMKEVK